MRETMFHVIFFSQGTTSTLPSATLPVKDAALRQKAGEVPMIFKRSLFDAPPHSPRGGDAKVCMQASVRVSTVFIICDVKRELIRYDVTR